MEEINHTFEDVKGLYCLYIHKESDLELIQRAFDFASKKHAGQFRKSGQPYIIHIIEVAYIVASLQSGPTTLCAAILHDTIEDCDVTYEEIENEFSKDIADIVFSLTKIKALSHNKRHDKDFVAEGHRKIFLGMARDIRVIIIKLADRLHNMRTLDFQSPEKKISISQETLDVYVPIADRLGLARIKGELEDLCIKYLYPKEYKEIIDYLNKNMMNRERQITLLSKDIADLLIKENIPFEISSRVKHPASIFRKIQNKDKKLDEIYDIIALRIITETDINCYEILGLIHSVYKPIPNRFKDYIAVPKANMYQSLHTTIIDNQGTVLEVQIRTKAMDEVAEGGIAAHWRYKENKNYDPKLEQKEIMEKLHWFSDFVNISNEDEDAQEFMSALQDEIFGTNIYCFTPQGKVIDLPSGSTPLDFAYKVHSKVGEQAVGAMVNNVLVPLSTELKTGDVVEIKTNPNSNGPNEGWLKIVKTSQAKSHIKKFLIKKNADFLRNTYIEKGKQSLIESFRDANVNEAKMYDYLNNKVLDNFECKSLEDLFCKIGEKNLQPSQVTNFCNVKKEEYIDSVIKKSISKKKISLSNQAVLVKGQENILCNLSNCCSPIPGDDIVGYITLGKGIKVHRRDCPNVRNHLERTIEVEWNPNYDIQAVPVELVLKATDRDQLLVDVLNTLAQLKVTCNKIVSKLHKENLTTSINMIINVKSADHLTSICNSLTNITSVYSIERVMH